MYFLYADESGTVADAQQQYFVLAGIAVYERKTHWIETDLNTIAERFSPDDPYLIELHGSPMRSGRDGWDAFPVKDRYDAVVRALTVGVVNRYPKGVRLFASVIKKSAVAGDDPAAVAFEQISSRFDSFLARLHRQGNTQRGVIILDKSEGAERGIQTLAREFKYSGHKWGKTRNYAEVPLFLDSKASRLIQLADLVAYSIYRYYEHGDSAFYSVIEKCFDSEGGVNHGLYVIRKP